MPLWMRMRFALGGSRRIGRECRLIALARTGTCETEGEIVSVDSGGVHAGR